MTHTHVKSNSLSYHFKQFVKNPTAEGVDAVISQALRIVDEFNYLPPPPCTATGGGSDSPKRNYEWLKLQMKVWKSTAMNRRRDIVYNFKQIATHLEYVRKVSLEGELTYSQSDRQMYIDIITEYAELFRRLFLNTSDTD